MRLETQTKYKCDGCGQEQLMPYGWKTVSPLLANGVAINYTMGQSLSQDYCPGCFELMHAALDNKHDKA